MKRISKQMSETIELGIVLALSGGFMDAYSYMCRDHVFANAQTGNILLFGVNLSQGNWGTALHYLGPILAFIVGLACPTCSGSSAGARNGSTGGRSRWRWRPSCSSLSAFCPRA